MKRIKYSELKAELEIKKIAEFSSELKVKNNYNGIERKKHLNPEEAKIMGYE